jgi:hypothetical protein
MKNNQENKQAFVLGFQSEILQSHATWDDLFLNSKNIIIRFSAF